MIAKEFEDYLLQHEDTFFDTWRESSVMIDTHNVDHAILLLSQSDLFAHSSGDCGEKVRWHHFSDGYYGLSDAA